MKKKLILILPLILYPATSHAGLFEKCKRALINAAQRWAHEMDERAAEELSPEERDRLWVAEPTFKRKFEAATEKLLKEAREARPEIPKTLSVNGKEYKVTQFLGEGSAGGDGTVFLVETEKGPRVIKKFHEGRMERNIEYLRRYAREGINAIHVDGGVDPVNQTVLLQYVRGISVSDILHRGGDFDFTQAQIDMVRRKYDEHCRKFAKWPIPAGQSFNVFMDQEGRFWIIDPF